MTLTWRVRCAGRDPLEVTMDSLRAFGIATIIGFFVIMGVCALVGTIVIRRTGETLRALW